MDEIKYKEAFYTYYNPLVNYAARIVGSHKDAKDVVQDVFARLWEKKSEVNSDTVKSYLFTSTKNQCFDFLRKQKNKEEYISTLEIKIVDSEKEIDILMLKEKISKSLRHLPPKCKEIFLLSKSNGLTYQEIADHLGISKKTVENQMGTALKILREKLKES